MFNELTARLRDAMPKRLRIARELKRDIATGEDAHRTYQIGTQWGSVDETLQSLRAS